MTAVAFLGNENAGTYDMPWIKKLLAMGLIFIRGSKP